MITILPQRYEYISSRKMRCFIGYLIKYISQKCSVMFNVRDLPQSHRSFPPWDDQTNISSKSEINSVHFVIHRAVIAITEPKSAWPNWAYILIQKLTASHCLCLWVISVIRLPGSWTWCLGQAEATRQAFFLLRYFYLYTARITFCYWLMVFNCQSKLRHIWFWLW